MLGDTVYEATAERWHSDLAARGSHYIGSVDLAVSVFRGTSREPRPMLLGRGDAAVHPPLFDLIDQVSFEAQWTRGATLWKKGPRNTLLSRTCGAP